MAAWRSGIEGGERARRYSPLFGGFMGCLLAIFVLPSALNVPQSNPTQTLEFAPIPPDDEAPPPAAANLASLSLGTRGSSPGDALGGGGPQDPPPVPGLPDGIGERPVTKRCVGTPPRQTEDRMSPPCVAHFQGDNGGATHAGVTEDEVTILFYLDNFCTGPRSMADCPPAAGGLFDLWEAPTTEEYLEIRLLRAMQNYFNSRFQTYNRRVHFWLFVGSVGDASDGSPELRRADAASHLEQPNPFAVLPYLRNGSEQDYLDVMAQEDRLNFGSFTARPAEFFRKYPGLVWSYEPSIEESANAFASFVCNRLVPYPTSFTDSENLGRDRRLALLYPTDVEAPVLTAFAEEVRRHVEKCGGSFVVDGTYPVSGSFNGGRAGTTDSNQASAATNIATFVANEVTTIVWTQGYDGRAHTDAAANAQYYPEWVVAGDGHVDGYQTGQLTNQDVWDGHAWTVTTVPLSAALEESQCYLAFQEGNPDMSAADIEYGCQTHTYYQDLQMLFTGIQVAGPVLTPDSMDRGFHAIPAVLSPDPATPACFYRLNDYTCVKDATAAYWDGSTTPPGGTVAGCWRYAEGGRRFYAEAWPKADPLMSRAASDPCNSFAGAVGAL